MSIGEIHYIGIDPKTDIDASEPLKTVVDRNRCMVIACHEILPRGELANNYLIAGVRGGEALIFCESCWNCYVRVTSKTHQSH
jgi:hypothetical protein